MSTDGILNLSDRNKLRAGRTSAPDTVETLAGLQSDNTGKPVLESGRALQNLIYEAVRVESAGFDVVQESHGNELPLVLRPRVDERERSKPVDIILILFA